MMANQSTLTERPRPLPPALDGDQIEIETPAGVATVYVAGAGKPLLLVHSINAAAAAHEIRPVFEHYSASRRVYAIDLPGFGRSERRPQGYTPRQYTDAVLALAEHAHRETGSPTDLVALSLGCEFAARAAVERPELVRRLVLISPTGMDRTATRAGKGAEGGGIEGVRNVLAALPVSRWLYSDLLCSPASIRYFYGRTFGRESDVPEWMVEYAYAASHQPNAAYAPFSFLSGRLFSPDAGSVYRMLIMPVLVISGGLGDFSRVPGIAYFVGRPGWQVHRYDDCGAIPYFQQPERFFRDVDAFLA